ncbi:MAG: T9SS type A sorting domain-containing protein [Bacteroidota bacterium]
MSHLVHHCHVHSTPIKGTKVLGKQNRTKQNMSFEDFELANENAIKINFVRVTDDPGLEDFTQYDFPIPSLDDYINDLNEAFSEIVPIEQWNGFEKARVTLFYSEDYAFVDPSDGDNPTGEALSFFASSEAAFSGYVNIFLNDIADAIGIGGTTFLNQELNGDFGPTMMVRRDFETIVTTHEMGHVVGMQHTAGFGYPPHFELNLFQGEKLEYTLFEHSAPEIHYMGSFLTPTYSAVPFTNWLFTAANPTYVTALYDDVTKVIFKNWLLMNEQASEDGLDFSAFQPDNNVVNNPWLESKNDKINSVLGDIDYTKMETVGPYGVLAWQGENKIGIIYKENNWDPIESSWTIPGANFVSDFSVSVNQSGHAMAVVSSAPGNVHVLERENSSASWTAPLHLTEPIGNDFSLISSPYADLNSQSNAVVVWEERKNTFEDFANVFYVEKSNGGNWTEKVQLNTLSEIAKHPFVVQNDRGDALILWQEVFPRDSASFTPGFEYFSGYSLLKGKFKPFNGNWQDEEVIMDNEAFNAGFVTAALDEEGNSLIIWRQAASIEDFGDQMPEFGSLHSIQRSTQGDLSEVTQISPGGLDAYHRIPEFNPNNIVLTGDGSAYCAWWAKNDNDYNVYVSKNNGISWEDPVKLSSGQYDATLANLAVLDDEQMVVTWQRYNGVNMIIEMARLDFSSNQWSSPARLSEVATDSFFPSVSSNGEGLFTTAWHSYSASTGYQQSEYVINLDTGTDNPDLPLSIENNIFSSLKVYPNPTKDIITLNLPTGHSFKNYSISNVLGETMMKDNIVKNSSGSMVIDINSLIPGIYFFQLNTESYSNRFRVIKK